MKKVEILKFDNGFAVINGSFSRLHFEYPDVLQDVAQALELDDASTIAAYDFDTTDLQDMSDLDLELGDNEEFDKQLDKTVKSMFTRISEDTEDV